MNLPFLNTGDAMYNMLRLAEVECDDEEKQLNPHKLQTTEVWVGFTSHYGILALWPFICSNSARLCFLKSSLQVLHSPFDDIIPRETKKSQKDEDKKIGQEICPKQQCLIYYYTHFLCSSICCWLGSVAL